MGLWAVVPVKPLRRGKSRLAGVLSEEERTLLNYTMLGHTLKVISEVQEIGQTLVVSRDSAALALARDYGARTLQEEGAPELNMALKRATIVAEVYATRGVLILPADIPLLTAKDLRELIGRAKKPPVMVIAPDRRKDGTNALLLSPAGLIEFAYGPNSFKKHVDRANKLGIHVEVCDLPSLALDLDLPEDLELLRQMETSEVNR